MPNTFGLSGIPYMHDAIPSATDKSIIIDIFEGEDTVIMTYVVPAGWQKVMDYTFGVYIKREVPSSQRRMWKSLPPVMKDLPAWLKSKEFMELWYSGRVYKGFRVGT